MAKTTWLLCLCILCTTLQNARAQTYSLKAEPSADALVITFPKKAPAPQVLRTGPKQVELLFPAGTTLAPVPPALGKGRHVMGVGVADNVLVVQVAEEAFGFISSPKGDKALSLQVFYDPAGSRWRPAGPPADEKKSAESILAAPSAPGPPVASAPPEPAPSPPVAAPGNAVRAALLPTAPPETPAPSDAGGVPGATATALMPASAPPQTTPAERKQTSSVRSGLDLSSKPEAPAGQTPGNPLATPQPNAPAPETAKPSPGGQPAPVGKSGAAPNRGGAQPHAQVASQVSANGQGQAPAQPQTKETKETKASAQIPAQTPVPAQAPAKGSAKAPAQAPAEAQAQNPAPAPTQGPAPSAAGQAAEQVPAASARPAGGVRGAVFEPITEEQKSQARKPGDIAAPAAPDGPEPAKPEGKPGSTPEAKSEAKPGVAPEAPEGTPEAKPEESKPKTKMGEDTLEDTALLVNGQRHQENGQYDKAMEIYKSLLDKPDISQAMREEVLYRNAEALFDLYRDTLPEHFAEVNDGLQRALNFNTKSRRIPRALIYLGALNMRMNNLPEARAYFNLLKNKYPLDESVPLVDVYWGQYYSDLAKEHDPKANYGRAAEAFKNVLQNSPESKWAKEAALGLAKCLLELKQYSEAGKIIDYIDKRWPRFYVDSPSLRRISGDVAFKLGEFQRAKDEYLWFYNLLPGDPGIDMVLSRLGDVNARLGKNDAAREYYDMTIRLHPGSDGALISMMRLAEQGVYDTPTMQEMTKAFASPKDVKPDQIYKHIVTNFPDSPMAPLAQLKLAMWQLYKKDYLDSLESVSNLLGKYPGNEVEPQAIEVAGQAFAKLMPTLMGDMNYKRIFELWNKYPFLASHADLLPHKERLGVALALYYAGFPRDALTMAEPYLTQGANENSEKALALCLTIYRENQDWPAILATVKQVADWKLSDNPRRTLEFTQAMALEHTGDFAKSRLLWARLMNDPQLDPAKKGYALYYQARTAMERQDYEKALAWSMDARGLLEEAAKDTGKTQDATLLIIEANQGLGRYPQALQWCDEYAKGVPEQSQEWASIRFRMATLQRRSGNMDAWRSILENLRDTMGDTLYGKMAASELTARTLEEGAGKLNGPM